MSNWWTFSALLIELVGAALVARGLSLQDPRIWVEGPGSPRWGYSADLDVDFASNSADASTGFFVFAGGIVLQAVSLSQTGNGSAWLLVIVAFVAVVARFAAKRLTVLKELAVFRVRIPWYLERERKNYSIVVPVISQSEALVRLGFGRHPGEDDWQHLNRRYGFDWCPSENREVLSAAFESVRWITTKDDLGELWLPWYVHDADPTQPVLDLRSSDDARQLQIKDVFEDGDVRAALAKVEGGTHKGPMTHLDRIQQICEAQTKASHVELTEVPATRTDQGLLLRDCCHRCCALYVRKGSWSVQIDSQPATSGDIDAEVAQKREH